MNFTRSPSYVCVEWNVLEESQNKQSGDTFVLAVKWNVCLNLNGLFWSSPIMKRLGYLDPDLHATA